jgi:hypothetical protein
MRFFFLSHRYIAALQWILIFSNVPVAFHVITNTDSIPIVEKAGADADIVAKFNRWDFNVTAQ